MYPRRGPGGKRAGGRKGVCMRTVSSALFFVLISVACGSAVSQEAVSQGGDVPLSEQLRGLDPEPRIAYLRYLLETQSATFDILFQMGVAFHESEDWDSALYYYERAGETDSIYSKTYVNMGVIYDELGRLLEALTMFETAAGLRDDDILAHAHAGFMRYQLEDYEAAWNHLERALEIDPRHPQPHFYLAIFFWENRMYREALREWETVVELDDGYLAGKARENIIMLQGALQSMDRPDGWEPER